MQIYGDTKLFSPSDLINYLGCPHATFLDLKNLENPVTFPPDDDHMQLLQEKGLEHEQAYLDQLKAEGKTVVEITGEKDIAEKAELTRKALAQGSEVVFQGAFLEGNWQGYSDFLVKVDKPSLLGDYSYEVADTKLSRSAKPKHLIQMCIYSDILNREQGAAPEDMHVFLGSNETASVRVDSVFHYFEFARRSFLQFVNDPPEQSEGAPCSHCSLCRWSSTCEAQWEAEDHLSLVAGLSRSQAVVLRESGVTDLKMLAEMPVSKEIPGIQSETLTRLRDQARLQAAHRETGERNFELLQSQPGKGLSRLPQPSEGDMFFDMEGDPLFEDGLEYLFGIITVDDGVQTFHTFWAHDRDEEKQAFQNAMDFMVNRLADFPDAHIYHYASYEETALKRLAMFHGTREGEVDDLLSRWYGRKRKADILDDALLKELHKQMFGQVWKWAGKYRQSLRNIGIDAYRIPTEMRQLVDNVRFWVEKETYPPDEIAVRFSHQLVSIHPFPNGNGRHCRMAGDYLAMQLGQPPFTWGRTSLTDASATRKAYIAALQAADRENIEPLKKFARD